MKREFLSQRRTCDLSKYRTRRDTMGGITSDICVDSNDLDKHRNDDCVKESVHSAGHQQSPYPTQEPDAMNVPHTKISGSVNASSRWLGLHELHSYHQESSSLTESCQFATEGDSSRRTSNPLLRVSSSSNGTSVSNVENLPPGPPDFHVSRSGALALASRALPSPPCRSLGQHGDRSPLEEIGVHGVAKEHNSGRTRGLMVSDYCDYEEEVSHTSTLTRSTVGIGDSSRPTVGISSSCDMLQNQYDTGVQAPRTDTAINEYWVDTGARGS